MTKSEKKVLIISAVIHIIALIWGIAVMIVGAKTGYQWQNTVQHFLIATCFFVPIVAALFVFRRKVENKAVRFIMLLGIIHILFGFVLEGVEQTVILLRNII